MKQHQVRQVKVLLMQPRLLAVAKSNKCFKISTNLHISLFDLRCNCCQYTALLKRCARFSDRVCGPNRLTIVICGFVGLIWVMFGLFWAFIGLRGWVFHFLFHCQVNRPKVFKDHWKYIWILLWSMREFIFYKKRFQNALGSIPYPVFPPRQELRTGDYILAFPN